MKITKILSKVWFTHTPLEPIKRIVTFGRLKTNHSRVDANLCKQALGACLRPYKDL